MIYLIVLSTSRQLLVVDEFFRLVLGGSTGRISLIDMRSTASESSSSSPIVASIVAHKGSVTGLSWLGSSAKTLISTSLDGSLAHYGAAI